MFKKQYFTIILFVFLALAVSCQEKPNQPTSPELNFLVDFFPRDEKTIDILFSVQTPKSDLSADKEFDATMELTGPDGKKRASFIINQLPDMEEGDILELVNWHGQLDPGQYKLEWGAEDYGQLVKTFEVVANPSGLLDIKNQNIIV